MRYIAVLFLLAGCVAQPPIISDINDSAVHIQASVSVPMDELDAKAAEGCAVYGKTRTDGLSARRFGEYGYMREVLYACK